jgi:phenylalanyl-tRNA synthetase beta chain
MGACTFQQARHQYQFTNLVKKIARIDGLDNVEIPALITILAAVETLATEAMYQEKSFQLFGGPWLNEIFTNSITNGAYYTAETITGSVKMMNNLSADLDILRPSMLETGLESLAPQPE